MTRPRLPLVVVGVIVPALVALAGLVASLLALPAHDIAVHWGVDGTADGFAPAWTVAGGMGTAALFAPLGFGVLLAATRRDGTSTSVRFLAAVSSWFATWLAVLGAWSILTQQQPDAEPPAIGLGLLVSFGAATVLGLAAWWLAPPVDTVMPETTAADPLPLRGSERAVWIARTRMPVAGVVAIALGILVALGASVVAVIATRGALAPLLAVPVVLLLMLALTARWTVRVDGTGLTVQGLLGWPVFRVPAAEIAQAGTVELRALDEFGGWGIRLGRGRRFGVITRSGEALEVRRRDGRAFVVTVDDAATAASLLEALATR